MTALLTYLAGIMEGKDGLLSWPRWIIAYQKEIEQSFGRGVYLRLKYDPFNEILKILTKHHIQYAPADHPILPYNQGDHTVPRAWLTECVTHTNNPDYRVIQPHNGYLYADLIELLLAKETGDELWHWHDNKHGSSGLCLVRNNEPIFAITTAFVLT